METFAQFAEASALGQWARGSASAYPIANLAHLLGLILLVGGIGVIDLRLLGAFRALPLPALSRALTPLALTGLALMATSGPILFAADAVSLARSDLFIRKLVLIGFGLSAALLFRWRYGRRLARWDDRPPLFGRLIALFSLANWLTVAALGRLIAYA